MQIKLKDENECVMLYKLSPGRTFIKLGRVYMVGSFDHMSASGPKVPPDKTLVMSLDDGKIYYFGYDLEVNGIELVAKQA